MEYSYLFAIAPPPALLEQIEAVRKEFAANFSSEEALRRPVHATLYMPFSLPEPMGERDLASITDWMSRQTTFELSLKNFGFFEKPKHPVVFIDVADNPALKELNSGLSRLLRLRFEFEEDTQRTPYHPHFTIGFRDLSPEIFPDIKRAYSKRPFSATFLVDRVMLFRYAARRYRMLWEPFRKMPLGIAWQTALW